jgi:uncharacterized protein (UPF0264 family)
MSQKSYRNQTMRLLVSVADATEASAALVGGADVIDAKDATAGALGAVSLDALSEIRDVVAGARLLTAALGDAIDEASVEESAYAYAAAGAVLVKVGFAGIINPLRVGAIVSAAVRGAQAGNAAAGVIAVAYADADRVASMPRDPLVEVAGRAGAKGLLLDTADKMGPGLRGLVTPTALAQWVVKAHDAGLLVALAGQLTADDLSFVREAGADIVGVRGAACEGGRTGRVTAERVRQLRLKCGEPVGAAHGVAERRV